MKRPFNWKLFSIVWGAAFVGAIAIIPFALAFQAAALEAADLPLPLWQLVILGLGQSAVLIGFAAGIGLLLAGRVGLGLPLVEAWLKKEPIRKRLQGALGRPIVGGVLVACVIVGLELLIFVPLLTGSGITLPENPEGPVWQSLLASLYGGITEEVLVRLFLMTLLVWIGAVLTRSKTGQPSSVVLWIAIVLAAIAFGLGHLPATAALGLPLNGLVITRAVLLNGVGGVLFGALYVRRGLESAMLAHYAADIMLLVVIPQTGLL